MLDAWQMRSTRRGREVIACEAMETVCSTCGAPAKPGVIVCEFCERPISVEAAQRAIKCKQCATLNAETAQQCTRCKQWLVVQCLFCSHVTRHDAPACGQCNEPFMGAAERKAQRDAQARHQQMFQVAGAVAPLASSLLGGVAGAMLGGSFAQSSPAGSSWGGSPFGGPSHGGPAYAGPSGGYEHGGRQVVGDGLRGGYASDESAGYGRGGGRERGAFDAFTESSTQDDEGSRRSSFEAEPGEDDSYDQGRGAFEDAEDSDDQGRGAFEDAEDSDDEGDEGDEGGRG